MAHSNHHGFLPDLQISRPIEAFHGLEHASISQWSFCGKKMEANSVFNKFQKTGSKLGGQRFCIHCSHQDSGNALPNGVLLTTHKARAHYSQSFCSEKLARETTMPHLLGSLKDESPKLENLIKRGCICRMDGAAMVHVEQPGYDKLKSCSSLQGTSMHDPHIMYESGFCDGQCYTQEKNGILQAFVARSTAVTVNSGFSVDFGPTQQVGHTLSLEIPQKPPAPFGFLSLGVCGNALIMRVGSDARCFHQQGLVCGWVDFHEQIKALDMLYASASTRAYDRFITGLSGSTSEVMVREPVSVLKATTMTTKNRPDKLKGKSKQKKQGKTATLTRDLFERSSFHLCEVIFCYPFMSPNSVASNFQRFSRESLRELVGVVNQVAVGLAGTGVALMLFVASRMLSINAAFDKDKMVSLAMGVGLLFLSLAMKRVADVVKCMADAYSRARAPRKEHLIRLQKELQGIALNAFPLIAMCLVRFG